MEPKNDKPVEKAEEKKAPAPKKRAPAKAKVVMYVSKKLRMYHPEQNIRFEPGVPTACNKDLWLQLQINADLIQAVK